MSSLLTLIRCFNKKTYI